jgi:hypothetical protein
MKRAVLAGFSHAESFINKWHMDYVSEKIMASPVLLFLHRDALVGTVLEKPEFLSRYDFEVYTECRNRTPEDDFMRMVDDLVHFRINL